MAKSPPSSGKAPNFLAAVNVVLVKASRGPNLIAVKPLNEAPVAEPLLAQWVQLAREGEAAAFERIVATLQGRIRAFTRAFLRDAGLGDDAAQETFLRIWKGLKSYREEGVFTAWCFRLARNTCIEFVRKRARTPVPTDSLPNSSRDDIDEAELRRSIREAVDGLGEPCRSTVLLWETGLTYDEIADAMSCPVGTVRSRLFRAKHDLAERLAPQLDGGDY